MRISSISLTNFRSFKETQTLELAPVTLMFGPNNVGKSTVLMALAYIYEILNKGNCNPRYLEALGNKKIGGFYALVNGQDFNKNIKINVKFETENNNLLNNYNNTTWELFESLSNSGTSLFSDNNTELLQMKDIISCIDSFEIGLEIAWSKFYEHAYIKNYVVWINDEYIGCISSSEDLKRPRITELNTLHPLLIPENQADWLEINFSEAIEKINDKNLSGAQLLEHLSNNYPEIHTTLLESCLELLNPTSSEYAEKLYIDSSAFENKIAPIALTHTNTYSDFGALPELGKLLNLELRDVQSAEMTLEYLNYLTVAHTLTQLFVLPLDNLLNYLKSSINIGPLRVVPDIDYLPNPKPELSDWADGSAAWDELHKNPENDRDTKQLIKYVNDWLESPDKLATEYHISNYSIRRAAKADKNIKPNSPIDMLLDMRHVAFEKGENRVFLLPNQLGTGFSQMMPIIVAANMEDKGLISIEQPELHIHPRLQVRIADLFLVATQRKNSKTSFLIETHSEHLILRLLRRVRETTANDKESKYKVFPNDLSVLYLSSTVNGVEVKRLNITADGDFHDRWPDGFFDERDEELF